MVGKTFNHALAAFPDCIPVGILGQDGGVQLNPPGETNIKNTDKLILIAEDDSEIRSDSSTASHDVEAMREPTPAASARPEHTLLVGWNRRGHIISQELSQHVALGSRLTIAADTPDIENEIAELRLPSTNLEIELRRVNSTKRNELQELDIPSYDHIVVLGYSDLLPPNAADARTIITLTHLRAILHESDRTTNVVSEIINAKNQQFAPANTQDFVVSNTLVSLVVTQASENEAVSAIMDDLLGAGGCQITLRPVSDFVDIDRPVNFYTVTEAARRQNQIAIGHRRVRKDRAPERHTVTLNPNKSELVKYEKSDTIAILGNASAN